MDIKSILQGFATVGSGLAFFAALCIYAFTRITDNQSGRAEGMLITCVIAGIALAGAATYISTQNLTILS